MRDLNLTLVQDAPDWQRPDANRARLERTLERLEQTDLVLLPEMFTTGFTMNPAACAETMEGRTVEWLRSHAARLGAALGGSLALRVGDDYVNRFVLALPDGGLQHYDKRHLFTLAGEGRHYRAGSERVTLTVNGWRIVPFICYDLRFPVWCRSATGCDLMVFVANWPAPRHHAWETLLRARAIENQCYVAGVNRVGNDANGLHYLGGSVLIDPLGATLADCGDAEGVRTASASTTALADVRDTLPFFRDADAFDLRDRQR